MKFLDKPLTLEELESYYAESEYIGQIALIQNDGIKALAILDHRDDDGMCVVFAASGRYLREKDYGKTWWAFSYVENEIDRDKWEPCEYCGENKKPLAYDNRGDVITIITSSNAAAIESDLIGFLFVSFCPKCGRPLTEEAREELRKRLRR